jgi:hypothetical protein
LQSFFFHITVYLKLINLFIRPKIVLFEFADRHFAENLFSVEVSVAVRPSELFHFVVFRIFHFPVFRHCMKAAMKLLLFIEMTVNSYPGLTIGACFYYIAFGENKRRNVALPRRDVFRREEQTLFAAFQDRTLPVEKHGAVPLVPRADLYRKLAFLIYLQNGFHTPVYDGIDLYIGN